MRTKRLLRALFGDCWLEWTWTLLILAAWVLLRLLLPRETP